MTKVLLKGILGEKFGEEWKLNVKSPSEAMRAISANRPNFRQFALANKSLFIKTIINGEEIKKKDNLFKKKEDIETIEFCPVFIGAASQGTFGIIMTVVGVLLIVAGILVTVFSGGTLAPLGVAMIMGGLGLLALGIITLLTPAPKFDRQSSGSRRSSLFDGGADTAIQGSPIPLIYGELIVDALPVASSITTTDDNGYS